MKVYIAGSTEPTERARAKRWHNNLRKLGIEVTSTWIESVEKHGAGNPRDMSVLERAAIAHACKEGVRAADLLWFLVPPTTTPTRGGWYELGLMDEISSVRAQNGDEAMASICSGDTKQSVFCALGQECVDDVEAFVEICAKARQPAKAAPATSSLIKAVLEVIGAPPGLPLNLVERELRFRFDNLRTQIADTVPALRSAIAEDLKKAGWSDLTADGSAHLVDAQHVRLRLSRTAINGSPFSVEVIDKSGPFVQHYTPRTAVAAFVEGWRCGLHAGRSESGLRLD